MEIREIVDIKFRDEWNRLARHPLQSWEWGEFRAKTGVKVVRYGIFRGEKLVEPIEITIHPIPHTGFTVGYLPKGYLPTSQQTNILAKVAKEYNCIFIKVEPKEEKGTMHESTNAQMHEWGFVEGRSLFTKYNFVLDVTPSEAELLASFKQKTRYNIKVAEKKGVTVEIDNSEEAFKQYLELTEETTKRQGFYAHSRDYHQKMWSVLGNSQISNDKFSNQLTAHLLVAKYNGHPPSPEATARQRIITTWVLFRFNDTLYYPYGASTREHREVMANNLVMWEAIKLAKKWNLKYLDMWGALGSEPDINDPWYGFHTFKSGYGARHVEYVGTWDYVARPMLYKVYRMAETLRWKLLRLIK